MDQLPGPAHDGGPIGLDNRCPRKQGGRQAHRQGAGLRRTEKHSKGDPPVAPGMVAGALQAPQYSAPPTAVIGNSFTAAATPACQAATISLGVRARARRATAAAGPRQPSRNNRCEGKAKLGSSPDRLLQIR
jgi:hypothetical protein